MPSKSFPPYCSKFRILFDFDTEKITNSNLSKILQTDTIKTQSKLIHEDKKLLISALTTYYKCDYYIKTRNKPSQSSIIKKSNTFYLIYLGKNLYKFGITNNFDRRLKEHKNDKKEKIREFCNVEDEDDDDEIISIKTYDIEETSGKLIEEQLKETIKKNQDFEYFENKNEKNDIREFFKWNKDLDSLIEIIAENVQNNISR